MEQWSRVVKLRGILVALNVRKLLIGAGAGLALLAQGVAVSARDNAPLSSPFEVGESPAGNYLAALVAGAGKDTLAAATFFREALRYDPRNPQLIERTFVAALANGNMPDAFVLADRLIQRDPNNGLAHLALGIRAVKQRQFTQARAHFSKGGTNRQRDITATLLTAWAYQGSGDTKRALEMVDKLREESFGIFRLYHGALIAEVAKNPTEAKKRMDDAYAAEKNTLRLVDSYARFNSARGNAEEAKRAYLEFEKILPRHPLIMAALNDLNAGKTLEPMVRNVEQGAAEVLYGLGAAGGRQGDELAAMIYLRLSLYLAPENGLALITLADIYERIKQNERAVDVYDLVPEKSPLRTNADIQTALILDALGRPDEAAVRLKEIIESNPKDEDALAALGNLQRSQKKFPESIESYTKALGVSTKPEKANWALFYFRGISYERSKQWPKAEADFKKAMELFPDQPLVLNYLGYSWVDQHMNLDESFKLLRRAVELRPNDGYIVDSLGWAHYRLGRYEEAMKELEKAIELKPSDPVINDHLGDAYWKVGRKLEAVFQWNHARDLKPEPDELPKILKKIENGLDESNPASVTSEPKKNGG